MSIFSLQTLTESYTFVKIAVLPNGFSKRTRNAPFVQNTTVFDAPFHIVFCILADDEKLKETTIANIIDGNLSNFVRAYFNKGTLQGTLQTRTNALEPLFGTKSVQGMTTIDGASVGIKRVFDRYICSMFSTARQTSKCRNHGVETNIPYIEIDDDCWDLLKNCQNVDFSKDICSICGENAKITFKLNNFLFLLCVRNVKWQDIPKVAIFQGMHFKLTALIEKCHNYFIAHVMRPNQKWYTFDHTEKSVIPSRFSVDMNIHLLCFSKNSSHDEYTYHHVLANSHTLVYNGERIRVQHGCAPNSVLHCLSSLFIDSPMLFDGKSGDLVSFLIAFARDHQKTAISNNDLRYETRYKILEPHFQKKRLMTNFT